MGFRVCATLTNNVLYVLWLNCKSRLPMIRIEFLTTWLYLQTKILLLQSNRNKLYFKLEGKYSTFAGTPPHAQLDRFHLTLN